MRASCANARAVAWALVLAGASGLGCRPDRRTNDGDGDGVPVGQDCDDADAAVGAPQTVWLDEDADGYGNPAAQQQACGVPGRWVTVAGDCDDLRAAVHPDAPEVCNGRDDNCDGRVDGDDPAVQDARTLWADADGDGWGAGAAQQGCLGPGWTDQSDGDCDDTDPAVSPDATERCGNGLDDDCSGESAVCTLDAAVTTDAASATWAGAAGSRTGARPVAMGDLDGDGRAEALVPALEAGAGGRVSWVPADALLSSQDLSAGLAWEATAGLARLGSGLSVDGDAQGDGFDDAALGADALDEVTLFWGDPMLAPALEAGAEPSTRLWGPAGTRFGAGVHWVGDVHDDGLDDLLVVADFGAELAGRVWLLSGADLVPGAGSVSDVAQASVSGRDPFDHLGGDALGAAGADLDGDGRPDIALGAPGEDAGDEDAGGVAVFSGGAPLAGDLDVQDADLRIVGPFRDGDAWFGHALAATDWDGDGFEDLIVGAPLADAAAPNAGAVFVFSGGVDTFGRDLVTGDAAVRVLGESAEDLLGWSVAGVTLPGGAGLVVGAPGRDGAGRDAGRALVFAGSTDLGTRSTADALHVIDGAVAGAGVGAAVAALEGATDAASPLLIGAPGADAHYLFRMGGR